VPDKQVWVSPLPCIEEFSRPSCRPRNGRTILFFGKVRPYKGLKVLLAAMPAVLSQVQCELLIVGEFYDPVEKYWRLVKAYGLEDHVRIDNRYVPNEEIPALFARADVLVLPYVSATQSGVARIAFSNMLPIIASTAGGLSEVVTEHVNGLLCPPGDAPALAWALTYYFSQHLGPVFAGNLRASSASNTPCQLIELLEEIVQDCRLPRSVS
jgi:glycosyltransferase involved in cell wall biosynthesis